VRGRRGIKGGEEGRGRGEKRDRLLGHTDQNGCHAQLLLVVHNGLRELALRGVCISQVGHGIHAATSVPSARMKTTAVTERHQTDHGDSGGHEATMQRVQAQAQQQ